MSDTLKNILYNRFYLSLLLLIIVYAVGFATVLLGHTDDLMLLTPFNLLFASGLLIFNANQANRYYWLLLLLVMIAGFLVEVLGVHTGLIFGTYSYGAGLGLKLFGVPLMIGVNWGILVFATAALFQHLQLNFVFKAALAATAMVLYDVLLEPVAIRFDFWTWATVHVPIQNYIAWWLIAFVMLLAVNYWVRNLKNRIAVYIVSIQTLFFWVLITTENLPIR